MHTHLLTLICLTKDREIFLFFLFLFDKGFSAWSQQQARSELANEMATETNCVAF